MTLVNIKKQKSVNKNVFATIINNGYKNILLIKKFLRDSMNRIQSKDQRIGAYKIKKYHSHALMTKCISKSMDQLLVIRVNYKKQLS